jgi:hypothetical protein
MQRARGLKHVRALRTMHQPAQGIRDLALPRINDGRLFIGVAIVEQLGLSRSSDQITRERARLNASVLIEFAKLCHRLLNDAPTDTHALYQPPVSADPPVFLANRVAQIHAPSGPDVGSKKIPKVGATPQNQRLSRPKPLISHGLLKNRQNRPESAQVGLVRNGRADPGRVITTFPHNQNPKRT